MIYKSTTNSPSYASPILGNGDLSFAVDCEGAVNKTQAEQTPLRNGDHVIYRAGRRRDIGLEFEIAKILSFGKLFFQGSGEVVSFEQELREQEGIVRSLCNYEDGSVISTECFIHPTMPLYCVQKTACKGDIHMEWRYRLCGYDHLSERAILKNKQFVHDTGGHVDFLLNGMDLYRGRLCLTTDRPIEGQCDEDGVYLRCDVREGEKLTLFLYLEDDLLEADPEAVCVKIANHIGEAGFEGLKQENVAAWQDYFSNGYVRTSDEKLNQIYATALYHLKCFTTRWSIPVGLTNFHWDGKFFAFDEYYSYLGLLGANQLELAKRVPTFRLEVCLPKAQGRQGGGQARFCWETSEYGTEVALPGHWHDHIFHMALIAIGAFEYYEYSRDLEFLTRCWPMIRGCARFYTHHMVYQDADHAYVTRCTDLERLGNSIFNPFMTSCGVIKTLEVTAEAAKILDVDEAYREECLRVAQKLRATLPVEEGRYVPHLNCRQKSIAVFAGKFPYNVLAHDDPQMHAAWQDFLDHGGAYGNMYAHGSGISPWYACWQAESFARAQLGEKAYERLQRAYSSSGVFGEMFEINEESCRQRPWFTTAAGIFMSAVNDMLVQSNGDVIQLLPACPLDDVSFRLAVKGGAVLEAEVKAGKLTRAKLISAQPRTMRLVFRGTETVLHS